MKPASDMKAVLTHPAVFYSAGVLLLLTGVLAYWPGLQGPFLFDDFGSLAKLGDLGGVKDLATFKAFVFGGNSGPTGRPLALLTFLIDASNWPADAWQFKRTNLAIHLLNGVLLAILSYKILLLANLDPHRSRWLALLSAALWLLHPFLVSTTLYAVQRMAQLSTLFVFLGMIVYLQGRSLLADKPVRAYVTMSASLLLATGLAALCKENGLLLPLLVGVLELTVFAAQEREGTALNRYWVCLFLLAPTVVLVLYLGTFTLNGKWLEPNVTRGISVYERLLTEARVLVDYLRHWFVPELYTSGVFQDHYTASTGFLKPLTTAMSILFHVVLISVSVVKRKKWPLLAFAVLFFYAAHLMESTVVNLELYFEHRNYLAAAFLFLPVVVALQSRLNQATFVTAALIALLMFAGFTRYSATVWGSYPTLVEAAAKAAPTSARAQQQYSQLLFNAADYERSMQIVDAAIERRPRDEGLLLQRAAMRCQLGTFTVQDFEQMSRVLTEQPYDLRGLDHYRTFVSLIVAEKCQAISMADVRGLFSAMLAVPTNADPKYPRFYQIKFFIGLADIHLAQPQRAFENFQQSLESRPDASRAMLMASLMASNEYFDEALAFSDIALTYLSRKNTGILSASNVNESDIREFQEQVRDDMNAASAIDN